MRSMTGYGRALLEEDGREMTVEVRSVNHRFLDVSCRLPRSIGFLEDAVRKGVAARLARGHVDVFVNYVNRREDAREVRVDTALAKAYRSALAELGEAVGIEPGANLTQAPGLTQAPSLTKPVSLIDYAQLPDVLTVSERQEDQDALRALLQHALEKALDQLCAMRELEGANMRADILSKMDAIASLREQIASRAPRVVEEYREKLRARLGALLSGELDEARFATEVAIFADRAAIDEELVRLGSHIAQIRETAAMQEPVGRKLDFLVQELNREVNTIGSKASDAQIAQHVVAAKGEIEKLREQVQNIE